jgi:hypothetical protein
MRNFIRISAALSVALASLVVVAAASADPRVPLGSSGPFELTGYCSFPVLVTYTRSNEYIIHQTQASDGTTHAANHGRPSCHCHEPDVG